jgi:hypothetical protein
MEWASIWLEEMRACGLPGGDFLVKAPNVSMDSWINRPATYSDFSRSLHLLLMVHAGESPNTVVEFTPHSCRHVQVTAATQLAAQGIIGESALEALGHWEKGSKMTRLYDSERCVTELQTRSLISSHLRSGWRPAVNGELPMPATPAAQLTLCPATPKIPVANEVVEGGSSVAVAGGGSTSRRMVLNTQRNRVHLVCLPGVKSVSGMWTCENPIAPSRNAEFNGPMSAKKCRLCFSG